MVNIAAVDLGTNSCRLLITDEQSRRVYNDDVSTKLGEGLYESGRISDAAMERGFKCLSEYADRMRSFDVKEYRAIATAACRTAENGQEFVKAAAELCGLHFDIISAEEEALLNIKGARLNAKKDAGYVLAYDLGGGSTEITLASNEDEPRIIYTLSVPLGARNGAEAFDILEYDADKAAKLEAEVHKYTSEFLQKSGFEKYRNDCDFLAVSSTPLRLVCMHIGTEQYDRFAADGKVMSAADYDETIDRVRKMDFAQMSESLYIGENRASIFQAACVIFRTIYTDLRLPSLTASLKGALEAIAYGLAAKWRI